MSRIIKRLSYAGVSASLAAREPTPRRHPLLLVLLALTTLVAVAGGIALAASPGGSVQVAVAFDDQPAGTAVQDQYEAKGIRFGATTGRHVLAVETTRARSAPNAGSISNCVSGACANAIDATFAPGASRVSVHVGSLALNSRSADHEVLLDARDAAGTRIAQARATVVAAQPATTELAVTAPEGTAIDTITLRLVTPQDANAALLIDDLTFVRPDAPPPSQQVEPPPTAPGATGPDVEVYRDFELQLRDHGKPVAGALARPGGKETYEVAIVRKGSSTGPIAVAPHSSPATATLKVADTADPDVKTLTIGMHKSTKPGPYTIEVIGTPESSAGGPAARKLVFPITITDRFDARIIGMDVSQGTQRLTSKTSFPGPGPEFDNDPVPYEGVRLTEGPRTIARVYANLDTNPSVGGARVYLRGYHGNKELPGSPLISSPRSISSGPPTGDLQTHTSNSGRFDFALPSEWTKGGRVLRFAAALTPAPGECATPACTANNDFTLTGIGFTPLPRVDITVLELRNGAPLRSPTEVFARAKAASPLGSEDYDPKSYAGIIDVSDIATLTEADLAKAREEWWEVHDLVSTASLGDYKGGLMLVRVLEWADKNYLWLELFGVDSVIGVHPDVGRSSSLNSIMAAPAKLLENPNIYFPVATVREKSRPLTTTAHEMGHKFGRDHAGPKCGGSGVKWPDDQLGYLQGIGFDRRPGHTSKLLYPGYTAGAPQIYDYMSYCANIETDADSWISPRFWEEMISTLEKFAEAEDKRTKKREAILAGSSARAAQSQHDSVTVAGWITSEGQGVLPAAWRGTRRISARASQASPLTVVARDSSGQVTSSVTPEVAETHFDDGPQPTPVGFISATLPADSLRTVELVRDGTVLSRRTASPTVPRVELLSVPRRIRPGATVRVRVRVTDPDPVSEPHEATLEVTEQGGRAWRTLATREVSPGIVTFRVPASLFSTQKAARLRATVSDGLQEGSDLSKRVRIVGRRPSVTVEGAPRVVRQDETVLLEATAVDDRGQPLRGRSLRWKLGRRIVGHGADLSLDGLRSGRQNLTLEVRDRLGRVTRKTLRFTVRAVKPVFLELRGPAKVSRRAGKARVRVASSVPARLVAGGRSYAVGRRARDIVLALRRGRGGARVRVRLVARGGTTATTLWIAR